MPNIKVLKNPGFLYDLNYLFYAKFNMQLCIDSLDDDGNRESYAAYLKEMLSDFGDISDDLYIFYHAIGNGRCFITTYYLDPYKEIFTKNFDFKYFKSLLCDTGELVQNMIRFYFQGLSEEELNECFTSSSKLFSCIKESGYSGDEKSKLYEFFIDPAPYLQVLQGELVEKEILLSAYYKENYEKILEAHNNLTFETLCDRVKELDDLSFLKGTGQILYTSFCLLYKYFMKLSFVGDGAVYLLGYDYICAIETLIELKTAYPLEVMCSALGETSRIQIMRFLLERGEIICKDLEKAFDFSGSTAYHHLSILLKSGALKVRNEGKTIYYSVNRKHFDMLIEQLKEFSNE